MLTQMLKWEVMGFICLDNVLSARMQPFSKNRKQKTKVHIMRGKYK